MAVITIPPSCNARQGINLRSRNVGHKTPQPDSRLDWNTSFMVRNDENDNQMKMIISDYMGVTVFVKWTRPDVFTMLYIV